MLHKINVSPGFCLLIGWFAAVNGWQSLAVVLSAAMIHEMGHWSALWLLGVKVLNLQIGLPGAVMETDGSALSYGGELTAVLAGPGANILCALLLTAFNPMFSAEVGANLVLGMFNLLPIRPLDGGRALYLLTSWALGPSAGERITRVAGTVAALSIMVCLISLVRFTGGSLWLIPAISGLGLAAARELGLIPGH